MAWSLSRCFDPHAERHGGAKPTIDVAQGSICQLATPNGWLLTLSI